MICKSPYRRSWLSWSSWYNKMKWITWMFLAALLIVTPADCGTAASDPPVQETIGPTNHGEETDDMADYDFSVFTNVEITGVSFSDFDQEQLEVLYQQARYCQAMTDADTDTLRELVPENATFTHMSGIQQTQEEYFADIENGSLRYFTIGIDNPVITVDGDTASVTFTSVLNANAYDARGTYRMTGTHGWEKRDGEWFVAGRSDR